MKTSKELIPYYEQRLSAVTAHINELEEEVRKTLTEETRSEALFNVLNWYIQTEQKVFIEEFLNELKEPEGEWKEVEGEIII